MRDLTELPAGLQHLLAIWIERLEETFGPRFQAAYMYGSWVFPGSWVQDVDADAIVDGPFDDDDRGRVWQIVRDLAAIPYGDDMDVWYIDLAEARGRSNPCTQLKPEMRCHAWALHRAHIHSGAYIRLHGDDPTSLVPEATWSEIDEALSAELEFIDEALERYPWFSVLNASRVLWSYTSGDVVASKQEASDWALGTVPVEWHSTIRRAQAIYARTAGVAEEAEVRDRAPAYVSFVRERIARLS